MNAPLRVLVVEDSETDAKLVGRELRRAGHHVAIDRVEDPDAMRAALAREAWDVIVSDWQMPRFTAPEALRVLKEAGLDVPFIIVSGTVGEDTAVEAMRAGASDYVLKGNIARLAPAVERELRERNGRASRRRSEEALRASEARFARLWDSGIVGICIADVLGNIHEANKAFLHMVGYSSEELLSREVNWAEMTPSEWRSSDARGVEQLKSRGVAPPWEKELVRKDGRRVPVLLGVAMLDYPNCIAFFADLSERKRAEEALRKSEEQLRQAQKMEAIGQFAGAIAHDFNNMLAVILSCSSLLTSELGESDPRRADAEDIKLAAERAATLTRQLLAFSRLQMFESRVLDLNAVVGGLEKMVRRLIGENIELSTALDKRLGRIEADQGQIEQVILNLIVNARDAMPQSGKLRIETTNFDLDAAHAWEHAPVQPGDYVLLAISDTGMGMNAATQRRIFEPFFTTKEKGKGTGLGLSTCYGIVKQSGGYIGVHSEPGQGSVFKVYLPRVAKKLAPIADRKASVELRGNETILLVEDDDRVRAVAERILVGNGYRVIVAKDAKEALALNEQCVDLVLSDVIMPGMSGPTLVEYLRRQRPALKALYMSGYMEHPIVENGGINPAVNLVQKPFTPESLVRKVRAILEG